MNELGGVFWPKGEVFWPITQTSQLRNFFWKCHHLGGFFFWKSGLSEESLCFPPSQARQNYWHSKLLYWTCFCSLSRPEPCMVYGNQWSIQTQRTSGLQYFLRAFSWLRSWKHIWVHKCGCAHMSVLIYSKYKLFFERALFIDRWKSSVFLRSLVQNLKLTPGAILD